MLLERTISQLDIGPVPPARALELGRLGYLQWLGGLKGDTDYRREAMRAYLAAAPFAPASPAVSAFLDLLVASTRTPLEPLAIPLPERSRRGGARARRAAL
ncbi:MAG: hypothetical protein AAFU55_03895 [Pseudomonadota bacterium]